MTQKDQQYSLYFYAFVALHVLVFTLLPALLRYDLPLDAIEAVSWGHEWQFGYLKHPPVSAWMAESMMRIFPQQMWAIYFLAQLCVAVAFIATWQLAKDFLPRQQAFMAILLLECVYYYNFTATEFNANIALLPLWALVTLYAWKVTKTSAVILDAQRRGSQESYSRDPRNAVHFKDDGCLKNWLIFAVFSALAMLAKYYAAMLFGGIFLFFLYDKNLRKIFLTPYPYCFGIVFLLLISPHIFWLFKNDFTTFTYAKNRSASEYHFYNHLLNPFLFFCSQAFSLLLAALVFFLSRRQEISVSALDQRKKNFLIFIGLMPLFLTVIPALLTGSKIRDMWGSVLWSWVGVGFFYFFPTKISTLFQKRFYRGFAIICVIAVVAFIDSQASRLHKYGHFDGKLLLQKISEKHPQPISFVAGDVWLVGNMNYFSNSRPHVVWDVSKMNETGGVLLWNADYEGEKVPPYFREKISAKITAQEVITLPFIKFTDSPPYRVGWAVVTPQENGF